MSDESRWQNKTVLVTGASSGIGRAIALAFQQLGAQVTLVARSEDRLQEVAQVASDPSRPPMTVMVADLLDPTDLRRVSDLLSSPESSPDLLVNNAAFGINQDFATSDAARNADCLRLGLGALVALSDAYRRGRQDRGGALMNISSIASFVPTPHHALYSAMKAAVRNYGEAISLAWEKEGLRVLTVCPGLTDTPFFEAGRYDEKTVIGSMQRMAPERVAVEAIAGLERNDVVRVVGVANRALVALARWVPQWLTLALAGRSMRPDLKP